MRDRYMDYSDRRTSDMTTDTLKPDRPDYDGGRTDGAALTDAPVYVEHGTGEDDNCGPVLGLSLTMYPDPKLMVDLSTGDAMNEPDLRDGVLDVVERTIAERYTTGIPEGYSVEVRLSGDGYMWDRVNQRAEVFVEVEFYGGLYRGDESADDWCERVVKNCPYHKVYNEMWMFYTAQRIVENALRAHLGMRPMCVRCDGSGTATLNWAPYEEPCERCGATGDEPE
jgi:hypothetical protein